MTSMQIAEALTPLDMFYHWEKVKPESVYLRQPVDRQWHEFSWAQVGDQARRIAAALQSMGVNASDRVGILSKNCAHWMISDLAIMMSGASSTPIFTTMPKDSVDYVLDHSNVSVLIVGNSENWDAIKQDLPKHIKVISLPYTDIPEADYRWENLLVGYQPMSGNPHREPDDELTTIYTSGSTGVPKGVVYNFAGAGHVANDLGITFRMTESDRLISYLPMAHGFERGVVGFMSMRFGCSVSFNEGLETFAEDMTLVRPTVFQCIPRLWTKFQQGVLHKFGGQETLDKQLSNPEVASTTKLTIQKALGLDDARILFTGSAPTPMALHEWYDKLDMPLCELYGQSEVLSGTSNLPWDRKPGTLGKPTYNSEIRIADNGEILIKAKAMMQGYLAEPEKTAETLIDGWIYTGDKGEIDEDGFLKITGRVKEIFKTGKGKYVAPVPIESQFVTNTDLEQVCLMGSGLPQTVLLVNLSKLGKAKSITKIEATLYEQVTEINNTLESHAKIAGVVIIEEPWTMDNGLLTHTMKLKRSALEERFAVLAESVFSSEIDSKSTKDLCLVWHA